MRTTNDSPEIDLVARQIGRGPGGSRKAGRKVVGASRARARWKRLRVSWSKRVNGKGDTCSRSNLRPTLMAVASS